MNEKEKKLLTNEIFHVKLDKSIYSFNSDIELIVEFLDGPLAGKGEFFIRVSEALMHQLGEEYVL